MKRTIITVILTLALTAFAVQAITQTAFSGAGIIESTTGGFKFPDGSVQLSATAQPCTAITYLPYTISIEGVYCFTDHLETSMTSGDAITIEADNVVINLNGWKLDGLSAGNGTLAKGIFGYNLKNITIKNGTVRGFRVGVQLEDDSPYTSDKGHLIEYIHADQNTIQGIWVDGRGNIVRNNRVINTGGSGTLGSAYGIYTRGPRGRVLNNDIIYVSGTGPYESFGLLITGAHGAVVEGNRITRVTAESADTYGIQVLDAHDVLVTGNRITSVYYGIFYVDDGSTGKYRDNLTSGVITPFDIPATGVVDAGGND